MIQEYAHRRREFQEGYAAFLRGYFNNPYNEHSVKNKEWQHGQDVAFLDTQKYAMKRYKAK